MTKQLTTTITKEKIARMLRENTGLSGVLCEELVNNFFDEINNLIKQHGRLSLKNFGAFRINNKSARPGQNLQTGKQCIIPPKTVIRFSPAKHMKIIVNK